MEQPLVSVVVVTYHSGAILTETLDSIYHQTYPNIELVLSDDHSADDTVQIARNWIAVHGNRFYNCVVRVSPSNKGITNNVNEGIRAASGKYIKTIAGDDLLLPNCIQENLDGCRELGVPYLFTWLQKFTDEPAGRRFWQEKPNPLLLNGSAREQYLALLQGNFVYGPLFFFETAFLEELGLFDERYEMMEDHPMWVKLTAMGNRLHFRNTVTVSYRISAASVSNSSGQRVFNIRYADCSRRYYEEIQRPALLKNRRYLDILRNERRQFYQWLIIKLGNDRNKLSVRIAEYLFKRKYLPGRE